jgi:hypothetical protein
MDWVTCVCCDLTYPIEEDNLGRKVILCPECDGELIPDLSDHWVDIGGEG